MSKKLVSIITPLYNSEKYIRDTIDSVLNQTYDNWEMIIVDDCSNDSSGDIVKNYVERDKRIKYIKLEKNMGVSNARNMAIRRSKGKFIAFLDSDDIWKFNKLEKQINFMMKNNLSITFTGYKMIDDNNNDLNKTIKVPKEIDYKELLKGNTIGCFTVVIDKEKLGIIEMTEIKHEDYVTWLSILKRGYKAYGLNEVLGFYRKSNNSITTNKFNSAKWTWSVYRSVEKKSLLKSIYYFINYALRGFMKHI